MADTVVLDLPYISTFCALPESTLESLVQSPTVTLVTSFLQHLIPRAQEFERLKAERLRLDVELETAVRGAELRARTLKANTDKALKEVDELRQKLNDEESTRASLKDQLQTLQSETATSSGDLEDLRAQVTKLEKSNRNTLALLDSKSTAHDKLAEEIILLRTKTIEHRRETSNLTEQIQSLENAVSSAKLLESQLRGEIDQQKRTNDWLDSELKTKTSEQTKFRKEKNARIAELQRLNDDANEKLDLLQHTETNLRKRLIDAEQKTEETFQNIERLSTETAKKEESFRLELETSRRLTDLQKQTADTARRRVQELEEDLERVRDDAAEEISQVQAEVETERQDKEAAESKVEQLESHIEKLESNSQLGRSIITGSPRPTTNGLGFPGTPNRAGSPLTFTPGSTRSRGGLSYTQMYGDYTSTKSELEAERQRNAKLSTTLDELIQDMERKEPEAQEIRMEYERLQTENAEISGLLTSTREERDISRKEARKWQAQVTGFKREADLLKQQLRDLSAQIKILLVEVQIREDGVEFSATDRAQLQQAAQGTVDNESLEGMSDTAKFISQRLVSYKNAFELQEKNAELLRIVRELGEQRESEEARSKANEELQTHKEIGNLRERVEQYKDEMKAIMSQSQSYIRERDMFRRMLSHRGQLPPDTDLESMFGNSVNGAASPRTPHKSGLSGGQNEVENSSSHVLADLTKALKDQQSQFDAYRRETATDFSTVKEQAATLSKEKSQLQAEVARVNSQLSLAYQRYQMLQENFDLMKSESKEMQKRSQSLAENAAKQDLKTQQVAEELVEARSVLDSMRYENAHLKAEKELWKNTQTRLSEDNRLLVEDRTRLSKALSDSQHLGNERELADMEIRRRLQSQVESQEMEIRTLQERLERELEGSKNATLRRELESEQHRTRVDDLMKAVANAKEELISSKAARDQLEARIEELKIDFRNAEERAQALQPKPATQGETAPGSDQGSSGSGLNREQELGIEVADLRKELEMARAEVESARTQVEQYKAISQSSEEELQILNDTHDQYRQEMDTIIAKKDAKIKDLEQRVQDIMSELSVSNEQLSTLRSSAEESETRLENQKTYFETEITRAKDEAERHKEAAAFHQEDLKAQADIAQQAQQSYESELVKHGEATKTLQIVRAELNQIRLEVAESKADAENSKAKLSQNEEGWTTRQEQYEKEMLDMKTRHDDINEQNKVLHQQLESFSEQVAALQRKRAAADDEGAAQETTDSSIRNFQGVIQYLRREKEIVDVQYELNMQESKRLRQQLDYTQSVLDETRLKLDQERQRQNTDERHALSHSKLVDTLNELNVFRESSVTLRNEARQAQAQLAKRTSRVEELTSQIQPLQATIREIEDERDAIREQCKGLEEERNSWRERMQNILGKYDRIDPAELESLKEQLSKLQSERDEVEARSQSLQEQLDRMPEEVHVAQEQAKKELRERLVEQFKARSRELSGKINEANTQNSSLKEQLDAIRVELETTKAARDEALANARAASSQRSRAPSENANAPKTTDESQAEDGEVAEDGKSNNPLQDQLEAAESRVQEESAKAANAQAEVDALQTKITELQQRIAELEHDLGRVNGELASLKEQPQLSAAAPPHEHLEKVKEELAAAQKEVEAMRSEAQSKPAQEPSLDASTSPLMSQQIQEQVASLRADLDASHAQRMQTLEEEYKVRVDNMKQQLTNKLREGKETYKAEMQQQQSNALEKSKEEHDVLIAQLKADHDRQLTELKDQERIVREQITSKAVGVDGPSHVDAAEVSPAVASTGSSTASEWTSEQIKALFSNNKTAKEIFVRNLKVKLEQETAKLKEQSEKVLAEKMEESRVQSESTLAARLEEVRVQSESTLAEKEQQIKELEEARQKFEKSKEQAVSMESKKWTAKVSMAEARSRISTAKLGVVSTAAAETPERAVAEVWAIAKDAKAAPPAPVSAPSATGPATAEATAQSPLAASSPDPRNSSAVSINATSSSNIQTPTQSSPMQEASSPAVQRGDSDAVEVQSNAQAEPEGHPNAVQTRPQNAPHHAGTGPAALRGLANQGSGIPTRGGASIRGIAQRGGRGGLPEPVHVPSGPPQMLQGHYQNQNQNQRGANNLPPNLPSNMPRRGGGDVGGGRGRGRGQHNQGQIQGHIQGQGQQVQGHGQGQNQGLGAQFQDRSPGMARGGMNQMNAGAGQFIPGFANNSNTNNKRPHSPADDSGGKRARGGHGGN